MSEKREIFVSVDVETAGPIPGEYSLLSIGACLAFAPEEAFSCQLKPIGNRFDPKALEVTGLSLATLAQTGEEPRLAMEKFARWLADLGGNDATIICVGFNAPFDWSVIIYYFQCVLGENPFGFTALDIKALYMGATGCSWADTRSSRIAQKLAPTLTGTHDALADARYQAEIFRLIRAKLVPQGE